VGACWAGCARELSMLSDERARLEREVQGIKQELERTVEGVSSKSQELKSLTSTKERLEKLGLEKVDQMSLFMRTSRGWVFQR